MRKEAFFPTVAWAIIAFNVPLCAEVVSLECDCELLFERFPALQTCIFDYDSQVLTTTDIIYETNPKDFWSGGDALMIRGRTDSPSTITVIRNITNKTGITWSDYTQSIGTGVGGGGEIVSGSASSTKLQTIAYPRLDRIMFSGSEPVLDGESFTVQFDFYFRNGFVNSFSQNAVPEPATIILLSLGGLTLLRKTRRMK